MSEPENGRRAAPDVRTVVEGVKSFVGAVMIAVVLWVGSAVTETTRQLERTRAAQEALAQIQQETASQLRFAVDKLSDKVSKISEDQAAARGDAAMLRDLARRVSALEARPAPR